MPTYAFAYYGGPQPKTPEEGAEYQQKWRAWVDSLGPAMHRPSTYLGAPKTVSSGGVSDRSLGEPLSGLSLVDAESFAAALEMAGRSPHIDYGRIEVSEVMEMPE
jgi:hypothetical protein